MATAGAILVSESSIETGEAQLHLLNIIGTGPGGVVQATESWVADLTGVRESVELAPLNVSADIATLRVQVELEDLEVQ